MMKSMVLRNSLLSGLALVGLTAFILACSSFSPDDTKIATPAFDAQSGDCGVAVFDRKTGKTTHVFTCSAISEPTQPSYGAALLRTAWIDNGRLLAVWTGEESGDKEGLNIASVPIGQGQATRLFRLHDVNRKGEGPVGALPLAGSRLLLVVDSNLVARLDLDTARLETRLCRGENVALFPAGSSRFVFYAAGKPGPEKAVELGTLDAGTFAQTPLLEAREGDFDAAENLAFGGDGRQVVWMQKKAGAYALKRLRPGQPTSEVCIVADVRDLEVGNLCFARNGEVVYAAFSGYVGTDTNLCLGFLEIPLDGKPAQPTVMVRGAKPGGDKLTPYFEIALSHDGKTLAVSTTYLCADLERPLIAPSDCALFLVDLSRTPHPITKAPLPGPQAAKPLKNH